MNTTEKKVENERLERMFAVGAHYGYSKSRRHPTVRPYVFGTKDRIEILDLEKTADLLDEAKAYMERLGATGKKILFVGGKNESQKIVRSVADNIDMPYVSGRWIGGTLTNFAEIKKRIDRLETLRSQREKGELSRYTKRERLMIDREIDKLEEKFGGLVSMTELPAALCVVDSKREHIAIEEARSLGLKIVALTNSDCNLSVIDHPVVANDAARASIEYFITELGSAYAAGTKTKKKENE